MNQKIKDRLQKLEAINRQNKTPELVYIYYESMLSTFIAVEKYFDRDSSGKVISGSLKERTIQVENPERYKPPEGFTGTIFYGSEDLE